MITIMKIPREVREQFRRHGRAGGRARAARIGADARRTIARRAGMARWIRERFGASKFGDLGVPGGEIVDAGLADLAEGRATAESLVVSIAMPRLRREGLPRTPALADPEDRLYRLLSQQSAGLAHARYGAFLRQMSSFADACRGRRHDQVRRAR